MHIQPNLMSYSLVPPFHIPLSSSQPPALPMLFPPGFGTYLPFTGYARQYHPVYFPTIEPHGMHFGSQSFVEAQVPPGLSEGASSSKSSWPHSFQDINMYANNSADRRDYVQDPSVWFNLTRHQQSAVGPKDNPIRAQQIGQTFFSAFMSSPFPLVPGWANRGILGPSPLYHPPAAPPAIIEVPQLFLMPHSSDASSSISELKESALRAKMIQQIEYYFSNENLTNDYYLLSLMDDEGWVPISTIATFNRVKNMSTDMSLILDALKSSDMIEIQGDKIRRRNDWSRFRPTKVDKDLRRNRVLDTEARDSNLHMHCSSERKEVDVDCNKVGSRP